MKISIYSCLKSFTSIPLLLFLFLSPLHIFAQTNSADKYNYVIPEGQTLYTEYTIGYKDLIPFKKEYSEISDLGKTKIIESGNFVLKEYNENGILKRDTLWFAISKQRILNNDTLISTQKLELQKKNNFPIEAKLTFKKNRVFIEQSDKADNTIFAKFEKVKERVHPNEEGLYFKLGDGETFEYLSKSVGIGLMTIPFKLRINSSGKMLELKQLQN